jgi:cysteine-rich repeat protein
MKRNIRNGAVALAAAMVVAGGVGPAAADMKAEQKCSASKLTAVGGDIAGQTACHASALSKGVAVDPACLTKATTKTSDAFAKAEAKALPKGGCATDSDSFDLDGDTIPDGMLASIRNQIDNGRNIGSQLIYRGLYGPIISAVSEGVVDILVPTPGAKSKCTSTKVKEAGKLAKAVYGCEKKVIAKNLPVDQACIQKAIDKMNEKYDTAETGADCQTTGDKAVVANGVVQQYERILPSIARFDGCGNGLLIAPETCDDGNTANFDSCPSDCIVDACAPTAGPQPATAVVSRDDLASVILELDYPEGTVSLPGTGFSADVTNLTTGIMDVLDLDHAIRIVVADAVAFGQVEIAQLNFVDCMGATPPVPGDFTCTVKDAALAGGVPLSKKDLKALTCSVTVP